MIVKTRVGDITGPDPGMVHPRVKFWAEAFYELIRPEQQYSVMGAAMEEAYLAGARDQWVKMMNGFAGKGEVVDVEYEVVEVTDDAGAGSVDPEPAGEDPGSGPAQSPTAAEQLPGSVSEVSGSVGGDEAEVAPSPVP